MKLFNWLDLETISTCNRTCPTCIRNSHPDREAIKSWFEPHYLPVDIIEEALQQVQDMGFTGGVRLSHYNEPTMDERLPDLARLVQSYGYKAYINTDGDFITPELAEKLDGAFEEIIVTLYMKEPKKSERATWIPTLFKRTRAVMITQSDHIPSHFSPKFDVAGMAREFVENPCVEPAMRCIINHKGQFTLCCEDVVGNFGLGTFPETSIEEYWFGKHAEIEMKLRQPGGRHWHSYCEACPKS
jgi:hypothetical protein